MSAPDVRRPRPLILAAALVLGLLLGLSARGGAAEAQAGCDEDGIRSSYDLSYTGSPPALRVMAVRLEGIAPTCNGTATVTLKSGGSTIASGSATIAGATLTVPMDNPPLASAVTGISVQITGTLATATATPSPTPTPTASPSPTPTPTATATATATPARTATPPPSPATTTAPPPPATSGAVAAAVPSPTPSSTPRGTSTATPVPTLTTTAVASATASAPPAARPPAGGPTAPESPKPEVNEATSDFVADFPSFAELSMSPITIATNLAMSLGLLFLILLAATIFNQTLEENHGALARIFGRFAGPFGFLLGRDATGDGNRAASLVRLGVILLIVAAIYSGLDSEFGFNKSTAALVISMTLGVGLLTLLYEGAQVLVAPRAIGTTGRLEPLPVGIIVAGVSVLITRVTDLHPGIVLGVVAGAIVPTSDPRDQGRLVFVAVVGVLILSLVSLALVDGFREFGSTHATDWWAAIPETVAVTLFIGGIEGLLLNMLPVEFMEGRALWEWSKLAWLGVAATVTFLFFHVVVNRTDSYNEVAEETGVRALFIVCAVSLLLAGAFWLACRLWLHEEPHRAAPAS